MSYAAEDAEKLDYLCSVGSKVSQYGYSGKAFGCFLKKPNMQLPPYDSAIYPSIYIS